MTKQQLRDKLIAKLDHKTWTKKCYAKDKNGVECDPLNSKAVKWCVSGLAIKIKGSFGSDPAWNGLYVDFNIKYGTTIVRANDDLGFKKVKGMLTSLY